MLVNLYRKVGFSFSKNLAVLNTKTFTTGVNGGSASKESLNNGESVKEEIEKDADTLERNVETKQSQDTEDIKILPKPWLILEKSLPMYVQFILKRIPFYLKKDNRKNCTPKFLKRHVSSIAKEFASLRRAEIEKYYEKQAEISEQVGRSRRILTGYNIFSQENMKEVRESILLTPNYKGNINSDSFSEIGKRWKRLTVEEKNVYNMRAIERAIIIGQQKGRLLAGKTPYLASEEIM